MIIGYSLAHNQLFAPVFQESLGYLSKVKELGFVEKEEDVVIGQKCLRAEYQKKGIMEQMDKILYNYLSDYFKYYMASIALVNTNSLNFVTKRGYKKVYASDTRAYFITGMEPQALTSDSYETTAGNGAVIRYRFATSADISALKNLNHEFLKENRADLSNGYLAAVFSEENWEFMISRKWVVLG